MGVSFRVDPIDRMTKTLLAGLNEQRKEMAAQFAREEIARAEAINKSATGGEVKYTVSVDGRVGAPLESVNTNGGSIVAEFNLGTDVLRWIADTLKARSPSRSGRYIAAQIMLADGRETSPYGRVPPADEYVFLDTAPYSPKIEMGKTKAGRSFTLSASNARVYDRTAKEARSRFKDIADIQYSFRQLAGHHAKAYRRVKAYADPHGRGRAGREAGTVVGAPAIVVKMKGF
jgi:hypothetical protein